MFSSTKALTAWAAISLTVLARAGGCSAVTDDQSDNGSKVLTLSGNRSIIVSEPFFGRYKTRGTTPSHNANCRWRVFTADKSGHWEQSSPRKAGSWNHLSDLFHRGTVTLTERALFETKGCPKWESRQ